PGGTDVTHGDHITRNRGAIRFLLFALGIPQALIGLQALFAPRAFYDDFPAGTDGWVHVLGPFDEHLVTDVGALFVALGVLLSLAAINLRRSAVVGAIAAWLIFSVCHLVWHLFNLEPYGTADSIANAATLGWTVIGGVLILFLARRPAAPALAKPMPIGGTRIEGVSDSRAGLLTRIGYAWSKRQLGTVTEPARVFAHHPLLGSGYGALEMATERADRVPANLKLLAATKAAALSGCEFCMDIGSKLSIDGGVSEAQLRALPAYATSDEFSELERLVLDFAVGMTRTPVDVSDELFARLREHFDEAQLVELANEVAIENYRSRFNWAFGIGAAGFVGEGAYCVRPEAVPAAGGVAAGA
ncbi:MAG TPA: carboxymuconolactone decarboxylase family protein, partial [Thermoleophilaceae bacterium]